MDLEGGLLAQIKEQVWSAPALDEDDDVATHHLAMLMADLNVGGVQKMTLALASAFVERGHRVDIVVLRAGGALTEQLPAGCRIVQLEPAARLVARAHALMADPAALLLLSRPVLLAKKVSHTLPYLPDLARYLREQRPDALISATSHLNLEAIWAKRLAKVPTRVLVSERSAPSQKLPVSRNWRHRHLPKLMRHCYPMADVVVAVSNMLADDLAKVTGLPRELITTIYNPVVGRDLAEKVLAPVEHPWLAPGQPPVLLGCGRLTDQKDFPTLIRAFARVRATRPVRLIILGGAKDPEKTIERRLHLMGIAQRLGVGADVDLPGYVKNPYPYMARAGVFVLSSRFEGLPGALIQALACGCPVVSTDCPTGPDEILEGGRYGPLVPMGDDARMADAISAILDRPPPATLLRDRAMSFAEDLAVRRYLEVLFRREG